jgi:cell division protein FtsW
MKFSLSSLHRKLTALTTRAPVLDLSVQRKAARFDEALVWAVALLTLLGLVMVYSASVALPDSNKYAGYETYHFALRQAIFVCVSTFTAFWSFKVPVAVWRRAAPYLFVFALALLLAVLIPGIGKGVNGAHRWLPLKIFNLQPSEIMKLCIVLYAADYATRRRDVLYRLSKGFGPIAAAVTVTGLLLMLEPDLGALGVVVCIAMGILFLGGMNGIWFGGMMGTLGVMFALVVWLSPWRRARFFAYLDPWQEHNALGKAYQLSHSLIAFGRGEITGVGLGNSIEKLHYLPEAHTDFLLAVVGEELGLIGVCAVIAMFYFIVRRSFLIARQALALGDSFAYLAAQGIGIWIGAQTFINMGVNLGLLPTKGLTLPLMSYGGSGVLFNFVGLAILLRIDYENRAKMRVGTPTTIR